MQLVIVSFYKRQQFVAQSESKKGSVNAPLPSPILAISLAFILYYLLRKKGHFLKALSFSVQ